MTGNAGWEFPIVVAAIHGPGGCQLLQVILADHSLRGGLCGAEHRQKQRSENGDDGHHHQQLNESECPLSSVYAGRIHGDSGSAQLEGHLGKRRITWILRIAENSKPDKPGDEGRIHDPQDSGAV